MTQKKKIAYATRFQLECSRKGLRRKVRSAILVLRAAPRTDYWPGRWTHSPTAHPVQSEVNGNV